MHANDIIDDYEDEQDQFDTLVESVSRLQVTGDEGTEHELSPDEACELMCDIQLIEAASAENASPSE